MINLKTQFDDHPAFTDEELESAGIPRVDLTRDKRPLYIVKVTDRQSTVPEADRKHFARGYERFLRWVRDQTSEVRFAGAIDLHGMLTARSFSFTLLGAGQRDYRKNQRTVETAITTFRDSEQRLPWSPLIAPADECPGDLSEPAFGGDLPMCSDQWGTVWDTINYQVTGSFGDWMDSPLGLDGVGIDNEMALSHLAPNTAFDPDVEQLHIDGNKGLIYAQIASLLNEEATTFEPGGKAGFVGDPERITHPGAPEATNPHENLPTQDDIEHTNLTGIQEFRFDVRGPQDGVNNRGMTIEATFGNLGAVSPNTLGELVLEYCGGNDHPGDVTEECVEIARYFNQSFVYLQAGARIDLNDPKPGPYRIRPTAESVLPTRFHVSFSRDSAYPEPEQAPYDVSRMDFFDDLNRYAAAGNGLTALTVDQILDDPGVLDFYDSIVVANEFMPEADAYSEAQRADYSDALAGFARGGGNLVLTDAAIEGLPALGTGLAADAVDDGFFYAGWADFNDGEGPTYDRHPLAQGVNKEGTAEGMDTVDGQDFNNRHQTYEPVPLGYYVGPGGSGNAACTSDRCDSPNWIVDQQAREAAGGTTAGRTLVRSTVAPRSPSNTGTSIGELSLGDGVVRIAGALLPDPTEENFHPYGLSSYALTYTGYQVFENLIDYTNPNRQTEQVRGVSLACAGCPVTVAPGSSGTATIEVTNTGNLKDSFVLSVAQKPKNFTASLSPTELTVGRGDTGTSTITIGVGKGAKSGTYFVVVEAHSKSDPAASDTHAVKVVVP